MCIAGSPGLALTSTKIRKATTTSCAMPSRIFRTTAVATGSSLQSPSGASTSLRTIGSSGYRRSALGLDADVAHVEAGQFSGVEPDDIVIGEYVLDRRADRHDDRQPGHLLGHRLV